jgi:hypothetical protein
LCHLQENLIRDDNKLILLASLSDSLEYVADSIERQVHLVRAINLCFIILFACHINKHMRKLGSHAGFDKNGHSILHN